MATTTDQAAVRRSLTRDDWTDAAIEVMVDSSVEQVRVESLARDLDVSKGSFYWHFQNRDELLAAVLDRWRQDVTVGVQERLYQREPSAAKRLLLFLRLPLRSARATRAADLELAILGWARRSRAAESVVAEVDRNRIAHVSSLFEEMGLSVESAQLRAHIAFAFIRYIAQRRDLDLKERFDMTTVVHALLAQPEEGAPNGLPIALAQAEVTAPQIRKSKPRGEDSQDVQGPGGRGAKGRARKA